jgi:hypothetical protein
LNHAPAGTLALAAVAAAVGFTDGKIGDLYAFLRAHRGLGPSPAAGD